VALPKVISDYLVAIATRHASIAYLQTTSTGHLLDWGGDLNKYGLAQLKKGDYVGDHIFYIDGFFPFDTLYEVLPHVQTEGLTVDIHLISEPDSTITERSQQDSQPSQFAEASKWILLLDTTQNVEEIEIVQQQDNDLSLLRSQYQKLIGSRLPQTQSAHKDRPHTLQAHKPARHISAVHREMSILTVKVCNLEALNHRIEPTDVLSILNAYVSLVAQVVVESGGAMNNVLGESIIASFGLLPSHQSSAQQAVGVAQQLVDKMKQSPPLLMPPWLDAPLPIGVSITTGRVAVGLLQNLAFPCLSTLGEPMQRGLQISALISPNAILVDSPTAKASGPYQARFQSVPPSDEQPWNPLFSLKL